MRPLGEWDAAYLDELANQDETASFEKKASDGLISQKIAQAVCAFANSGEGYIAFGFKDEKAGVGLDAGVPATKGREPVKDWAEALIPTLHHPPILGCEARFIQHPTQHQSDRGVLVIAVPLSERRPHWTRDDEKAYLRVGAHSAPMKLQTLLDISSRGSVPRGSVTAIEFHHSVRSEQFADTGSYFFRIVPQVILEGGPTCEVWGVELRLSDGVGTFEFEEIKRDSGEPSVSLYPENVLFFRGIEALFPYRISPVGTKNRIPLFAVPEDPAVETVGRVAATLYASAARPVTSHFTINRKNLMKLVCVLDKDLK